MKLVELLFHCDDDVNVYIYRQTDNPEITKKLYEGSISSLQRDYEVFVNELSMTVLIWYIKTDFLGVNTLYVNVY